MTAQKKSYDKLRADLSDEMFRVLREENGDHTRYPSGVLADRVLDLLGIRPDSTIVTPGDGSGIIDAIYGLTLLAHEHHGGHLDEIAACDAPWCLRGKAVLARLDPLAQVAGQFLTEETP